MVLIQSAATSNETTPAASSAFTQQLAALGGTGPVTFSTTSSSAELVVSSSGLVATKGALGAGSYTVSGTDSDNYADAGTWTFTLTVTAKAVSQATPTTGTMTTGKAFSSHLAISGSIGTVTYVQTSGAANLTVSSTGAVSAPATLKAGTYTAGGTVSDAYGDTGSWSFTLTVTARTITQAAPTTGTTTTGKAFSSHLEVSGSHGTVTFTQSSGTPSVRISSSGAVSAAAHLKAGTYAAKGTDKDSLGDTGTWSFTLSVKAKTIAQANPKVLTVTMDVALNDHLKVSGSHGSVSFTQSVGSPHVRVSSSGAVSAAANLKAGTYVAVGTDRDSLGDTGSWRITLKVTPRKSAGRSKGSR